MLASRNLLGGFADETLTLPRVQDPIEISVQQRILCAYCTHVPCRKRVLQLYCKLIRIKGLNRIFPQKHELLSPYMQLLAQGGNEPSTVSPYATSCDVPNVTMSNLCQ